MTYENIRIFAAGFGFFLLASTYAVAVAWTFRRRSRSIHEHAARIIFDEDDKPSVKESGRGR